MLQLRTIGGLILARLGEEDLTGANVTLTGVGPDGVKYQGESTGNGNGEFPGSLTENGVISRVITSQGAPQLHQQDRAALCGGWSVQVDKSSEECWG